MAKKKLFTRDVDQKLPWIRPTGPAEIPERLKPALEKARKLQAEREAGKLSKQSKLSKPGKLSKPPRPKVPESSPTGREILHGRYEKRKVDGTPSRQGERERSEVLKNAVRATFHVDRELLRLAKERAAGEGRPLSELVNVAIKAYLRGKG